MSTVSGKLTILADNRVPGKTRLLGEHGFAVYLETDNGNYLFDTGRGKTLQHNAVICRKDLGAVDAVILSHGHADHTGGLPEVLPYHSGIRVLAHPDIFLDRYRLKKTGDKRHSGMPFHRGYLEKSGARFEWNTDPRELSPGIHLTGYVPRVTPFETGDMANRFAERDGKTVADTVADDQSLVLETGRGLLIVLGCAHAGLVNIIAHARQMTGRQRIHGIIGGTHLGYVEPPQVEKTVAALNADAVAHLIPGHCTGLKIAVQLSRAFSGDFQFSHVGFTFEF